MVIFVSGYGQLAAQDEIVTERPTQSESSITLPLQAFQLETGFVRLYDNTEDAYWVGALMRYGLFKGFELRLGTAFGGYHEDSSNTVGLNPLEIGFKSYITKQKGFLPEISFVGTLIIPGIAKSELDVDNPAPVFKFAFTNVITPVFSIGYNVGGIWNGDGAVPTWFYTFVVNASITNKLGCFLEPYGYYAKGAIPINMINAGFAYKITPLIQADISGGIGLNDISPDGFISVGFSFRTK